MDSALLEPIISAAVALVAAVISYIGIAIRNKVKITASPTTIGVVYDLARIVVQAAETLGEGELELKGEDKYHYAEVALIELARKAGVNLDETQANALIHAALGDVNRMNDPFPAFDLGIDDEDDEAA